MEVGREDTWGCEGHGGCGVLVKEWCRGENERFWRMGRRRARLCRQRGSARTTKIEWLERGARSDRHNTAIGIRFISRLVNTPRVQRDVNHFTRKEREARGDKPREGWKSLIS